MQICRSVNNSWIFGYTPTITIQNSTDDFKVLGSSFKCVVRVTIVTYLQIPRFASIHGVTMPTKHALYISVVDNVLNHEINFNIAQGHDRIRKRG